MRIPSSCLTTLCCLFVASSFAADTTKVKVLDKLEHIDAKSLKIREAKAKIVATDEPDHRKVLELAMDYAKANSWSGFNKFFPEGNLNPKKYTAIRFWVRSNSGTSFNTGIGGHYTRKDGKYNSFYGGSFTASTTWTQITIPLDKFKRNGDKIWKNGAQVIIPGGEAPEDEDYAGIDNFGISSGINNRGTSTVGHLMFDGLELVEK
jgi:hypothetical protein